MRILSSLGGMALLFAIAFLLSSNRRAIRWRVVLPAFALQAGLAALVLSFPPGKAALQGAAHAVEQLLSYSRAGVEFVFGNLANPDMGGKSVAIAVLPPIVFFAALISILYYLGIMPLVIRWIGGALEKVTGISRVESLCAAANIFVGQSESPLVIRPYLAALTPSQIFTVMSVGMAGVAGTILAAYAGLGVRVDYLVAAAFMSAPGGVFMGKLIMPDAPPLHDGGHGDTALTNPHIKPSLEEAPEEQRPANLIMAAAQGAQTGVKLAVAVGAMLLAFVALIALANGMLGWAGGFFGHPGLTFQQILAPIFAPVFLLLGAPNWAEAMQAGGLFGTKIVLNEFVGFIDLQEAKGLSDHTIAIVTFALCGFANFSSIAIQMAVTGGLAPNQRPVIARLGIKALCAGALSNLMSAALAGLFLSL
ncbi:MULTISPECIES: NupC/NupG family nucleoside CNT transporter [unclassified Novosphingobium]|uniref:NupC/NupG family nucleoside CNT transporter n=1 Tax=Novosphingobium TaxID=165696 RepID=UPI001445F8DB|nr:MULTISPECIES: NupC/NupG family nucleoside CNT transporter [unclassified Novosphingobium]NKJ42481.1 CNT family concentrative nucleoside transporter [Novosphingobium sp. SG720]NMN05836.1 CNT family concentrative nucleoside transporter [Novosphingobium sp. SG919]NMN87804.1 CNT family concentrative nucleoside transporter [Novosphingobium sp. SG916]